MKNFKNYFIEHKQKVILYIFAFLFVLISFILSFFEIIDVIKLDGTQDSINGISLYFGNNFNLFALISFLLLISGFVFIPFSIKYKNIKVLQVVFIFIAIFLYGFLPNIINGPLHENADLTVFASTSHNLILIFLIILLSIGELLIIFAEAENIKFNVREICEIAMLVAFAVVLNFVKIPLQWSGSVNLQIIPLIIIALRHSTSKTFISCGLIFGLITCFTDGYGLFAFPLEYLIAFGSVAIISPFRKLILKDYKTMNTKNYAIAFTLLFVLISCQTTIRFFCASIDSFVFYFTYLEEATFLAAMAYNAPYVFLTGVANIIVISIIYYPLLRINTVFKIEK